MKVTVSKYLNVRVGAPNINADCHYYLTPGSVIEVEDKLYEGADFRGNTKWFKDKNSDNFYWSGGVKLANVPTFKEVNHKKKIEHSKLQWWQVDYGLDKVWRKYGLGKGAKVIVLDTGYSFDHPYSRQDVVGWNYVNDNGDFKDENGHGTRVTSVINGSVKDLYGIAPESSIFAGIIKKGKNDINVLIDALNKCAASDADIISISYFLKKKTDEAMEKLEKAIMANKNKIIICAVGNTINKKRIEEHYPAFYKSTLAVGSVTDQRKIADRSSKTLRTDLVAPGQSLRLIDLTSSGLRSYNGTSYATPYVAGIAALMISYARKIKPSIPIQTWNIPKIILDTCDFEDSMDKNLFGNGIINPERAFNKLEKSLSS